MARKVVNTTHLASKYDILSQTPNNYSEDNYFLKELQDKVNAEWEYRPNRVAAEYEDPRGELKWKPIEVVTQTVKSEKGKDISNDCRQIVFRNILEDRFTIGHRFRFATQNYAQLKTSPDHYNFIVKDDTQMTLDYKKFVVTTLSQQRDVWLVVNKNEINATSSVVIERCNGSLGSIVFDEQNVAYYHYEPVIQGKDLSSVSLFYNETAVSPQSQLLIIAQHNKYTKQYKINQRFIVGYDKVYRVKAINKFYSNSTFNPEDVGLMRIYLELTESSVYDDFDLRIAYQQEPVVHIDTSSEEGYSIKFKLPEVIPTGLTSEEITFLPVVMSDSGVEYSDIAVTPSIILENLPSAVSPDIYVSMIINDDGSFTLKRNRIYLIGDLVVTCNAVAPSGEEFSASFKMTLRNPE